MYNLGDLIARLGLDTKPLKADVQKAQMLMHQVHTSAERMGTRFETAARGAETMIRPLLGLAGVAGGIFTLHEAIEKLSEATQLAARIEVMNHVLEMTGKNAGYTERELKGYRDRIMALGIATKEAIHIEQLFIQSQMDVAGALKLARAAQDLAVISGQNSSEAAETLTQAIVAQRPILLKQFGIIVSLEDMYSEMAKSLGKQADALTEGEKRQAFFNAIMRQSATVAGSYETAMRDVGKLMTSLPRYLDEASEAVGEHFLPVMEASVHAVKNVAERVTEMFQSVESATSKFYAARDSFEAKAASAVKLADRYDALKVKAKLNAQEQEELRKIIEQLTAIMPAAASEWDEANRVIGINTERVRANLEQKRALFRVEQGKVIREWAEQWEQLNEETEKFGKLSEVGVPAVPKVQLDWWKALTGQFAPYKTSLVDVNEKVADLHAQQNDLTIALSQGFDAVGDYAGVQHYLAKVLGEETGTQLANAIRDLQDSSTEAAAARNAVAGLGSTSAVTAEQLKELGTYLQGLFDTPFNRQFQQDVDEMRKDAEDSARRQEQLVADLPRRQLQAYKEMLDQGRLTGDELESVWSQYSQLRMAQIQAELEEYRKVGASEEFIAQAQAARFYELNEEMRAVFAETASIVEQISKQMAEGMQGALENTFFDWFRGEVQGLRGFVYSFADQMLQVMSRIAAEKAAMATMEFLGSMIPGLQHGGVVTQPTLAWVGERGPEAVIPLSGEPDQSLWNRVLRREPAGTRGQPVNITVNVQTSDAASFMQSSAQVAARTLVSLANAGRNL